jgi:RNA polymerase sigma-70 factor (ECF subfamily)
MTPDERSAMETRVRQKVEVGDFERATTLALEAYGREVLELLCALHRQESDAAEAFSLFSEAVWQGLPRFSWRSSLRTWCYGIARNVSLRHRRDARRRTKRFVAMPDDLADLAARLRTETRSFLRTARRSKLAQLRQALPAEDQLLLLLRVERGLAWDELARVFSEARGASEPDLRKETARLRKRFQLVKERLTLAARTREAKED